MGQLAGLVDEGDIRDLIEQRFSGLLCLRVATEKGFDIPLLLAGVLGIGLSFAKQVECQVDQQILLSLLFGLF